GLMSIIPLCATASGALLFVICNNGSFFVTGKGCVLLGDVSPCVVILKCSTIGVLTTSIVFSSRFKAALKSFKVMKPFSMWTVPPAAYMKPAPSSLLYHMFSMVVVAGMVMPAGLIAIMHMLVFPLHVVQVA